MPSRLIIAVILIALLFLAYIFYTLKKKKINIKQSLIWILLDILVIICTVTIPLLRNVVAFLKIEVVSNLLFFLAVFFLFFITFFLTKTISELNSKVIVLTQELALLKAKEEKNE